MFTYLKNQFSDAMTNSFLIKTFILESLHLKNNAQITLKNNSPYKIYNIISNIYSVLITYTKNISRGYFLDCMKI